jgi:transposase
MNSFHYVGLDIHKKTISYCVKSADGAIMSEGTLAAQRTALTAWARELPSPWIAAMEATLFTGWVYDLLLPLAHAVKVAHPAMLKAISASKKKNDKVDARKITDLLRCDLLTVCYMAPSELRELRRVLRYRNLAVAEAVRMKNKTAGLLMEVGAEYNKEQLHQKAYFHNLLESVENVPPSVIELLKLSRRASDMFEAAERCLVRGLCRHPELQARVILLRTIPAVGEILALTWALEVGEPERFHSIGHALSYCGLTSAQNSSAGKEQRGPISKQRNKHLQTILIEAAKVAPVWNPALAVVHERELARGDRNRATLAVARKLVAYLLSVDRSGQPFQARPAVVEPATQTETAPETEGA